MNPKFYKAWSSMKQRCDNSNCDNYSNYGGRGITHNYDNFIDFRDDMYESYQAHSKIHGEHNTTLERINNDLGYFYGNIRWATREEQRDNMQNTIYFRFIGPERKCGVERNLSKFVKHYCLDEAMIRYHLYSHGKMMSEDWYFEDISKREYEIESTIREKLQTLSLYEKTEYELQAIAATASIVVSIDGKDPHSIIEEIIKECVKRILNKC